MGKALDPLYYIDGELDDGIKTCEITITHAKEPIDSITPSREAEHTDYGNKRYSVSMTYVPIAGRDNQKYIRWVKDRSDDHDIMKDNQDGTIEILTRVEYTEARTPKGDWSLTAFAKRHKIIAGSLA